MAGSIHIVDTPKGDAPLWVREQWVGLTLPLIYHGTIVAHGMSVLKPPRELSRLELFWGWVTGQHPWRGYLVDVNASLAVLESKSPEAAAWWRANAPHLLGMQFMFDYGCCDPVDRASPEPSGGDPARN
ncbi:MAG TPA: hypothetical protein VGO52_21265 [Hyphomonadaceae bacterium]|nr:hypothetical protein [Hyphomonadaceae bacterium]